MSKIIDLNKPLSDEDKAYLTERSRLDDIALNERRFGEDGSGADPEPEEKDSDDDAVEVSEDVYNHVVDLNFDELRTELTKYGLPSDGDDIKGMRTQLAIHLQILEDERVADREADAKADAKHKADPTK